MTNGWSTLSDYFNPADIMVKTQQVKAAQQQQQLNALAIQQAQIENAKKQAFQQYLGQQGQQQLPSELIPLGMQPTQPQTQQTQIPIQQPQAPQITPEQRDIIIGRTKINSIMPDIERLFNNPEINGQAINKVNAMQLNDPQIQATLKAAGFDSVDIGYDEKTSEAWQKFTKNWSKQELEELAKQMPGGEIVAGLPAGRYTIDYDPVNKRLRPAVKSADPIEDKSLTADTRLIKESLREKLGREPKANEILAEKTRIETASYDSKYGSDIGQDAITFAAEQYLASGNMPSLGRSAKIRAEILARAAELKKEQGLSTGEVIEKQASLDSMRKSLNNQQKTASMMGSFVRNIDQQVIRLERILPLIQRTDARAMNLPWRNYKTRIKGSANESILDMYLTEISSEVGKLATGSSASVAELSASTREKWEKIHDPNLPVGELIKLVKETQEAAHLRMQSAQDEITATKEFISGKKATPKQGGTAKRMTFNPETGRIE